MVLKFGILIVDNGLGLASFRFDVFCLLADFRFG